MPKIIDIKPPQKFEKEQVKKEEIKVVYLPPKRGLKKGIIFLIFILFFVGIFFLLSYFSSVKIEIKLKTEDFNFEKDLTVDAEVKSLDFSKDVLPGQFVDFEKTISQDFLATGKLKKEKKAEGVVKIINNSDITQVLVANTRLQPPSEKFLSPLEENEKPWFLTKERIVIPPKSSKEVKVVAYAPGEKYNIGPSKFSIPGLKGTPQELLVYGESSQPMAGGFKGEVSIVTEEDLKKAKESLVGKIKEEGEKLIKEKISQNYFFLDGVSKTDFFDEVFSATSGQEAEKFTFKVKIRTKGIVFLRRDLDEFIKNYIQSSNPEKEIWQEKLSFETKLKDFDIEKGKIFFKLKVNSKVYKKVDEVILKKQIAKNSIQDLQIFLKEQPWVEKFEIKVFPFWVKKIPENLERINLSLRLD
jgi:hypothetical protein